jgi:hypothetical protein
MNSAENDLRPSAESQFNPYAPPIASDQTRAQDSRPVMPLFTEQPWAISVTHDLTDEDLRRFVNCDVFYDARPLFGIVPQWVWYLASVVAVLFFVSFPLTHSPGISAGCAVALGAVVFGIMVLFARSTRALARLSGLCDKRTLAITPHNLTVTIPEAKSISKNLVTVGPVDYAWTDVRKIETRAGYVLFWLEGRSRLVLPLRVFPSDGDARAFLEAANRWRKSAH